MPTTNLRGYEQSGTFSFTDENNDAYTTLPTESSSKSTNIAIGVFEKGKDTTEASKKIIYVNKTKLAQFLKIPETQINHMNPETLKLLIETTLAHSKLDKLPDLKKSIKGKYTTQLKEQLKLAKAKSIEEFYKPTAKNKQKFSQEMGKYLKKTSEQINRNFGVDTGRREPFTILDGNKSSQFPKNVDPGGGRNTEEGTDETALKEANTLLDEVFVSKKDKEWIPVAKAFLGQQLKVPLSSSIKNSAMDELVDSAFEAGGKSYYLRVDFPEKVPVTCKVFRNKETNEIERLSFIITAHAAVVANQSTAVVGVIDDYATVYSEVNVIKDKSGQFVVDDRNFTLNVK